MLFGTRLKMLRRKYFNTHKEIGQLNFPEWKDRGFRKILPAHFNFPAFELASILRHRLP
jgi:hypothetical protein